MMSGYNNYNYEKIFFRRPLFTELNKLFLKFFTATVLCFAVLIVAISVGFYNKFPEHRIRYQIKQNYITQIVKYYENYQPPVEAQPEYHGYVAGDFMPIKLDESLGDDEAASENIPEMRASQTEAGQIRRARAAAPSDTQVRGDAPEYDDSMIAYLSPSTRTGLSVQSAIESIPALVKPSKPERDSPLEPYNARKKAYDSSQRRFSTGKNSDIDIADASFTDFGVVKGIRDYEETITVANDNKKFIKHCLDRYYRNDPTRRGQFVVKFEIHPDGYVIPETIRVLESDIQDVRIIDCIKRTIRRWRNFPPVPYEHGEYAITQKYFF